jgi:hypothetical protein
MSDGIIAQRQWPVTLTLEHPIEFGKELVASLEFREGCWGDIPDDIKPGEFPQTNQLMSIAANMCGKPAAVLKKLRGGDIAAVQVIALSFFGESQGAGKTHTPS